MDPTNSNNSNNRLGYPSILTRLIGNRWWSHWKQQYESDKEKGLLSPSDSTFIHNLGEFIDFIIKNPLKYKSIIDSLFPSSPSSNHQQKQYSDSYPTTTTTTTSSTNTNSQQPKINNSLSQGEVLINNFIEIILLQQFISKDHVYPAFIRSPLKRFYTEILGLSTSSFLNMERNIVNYLLNDEIKGFNSDNSPTTSTTTEIISNDKDSKHEKQIKKKLEEIKNKEKSMKKELSEKLIPTQSKYNTKKILLITAAVVGGGLIGAGTGGLATPILATVFGGVGALLVAATGVGGAALSSILLGAVGATIGGPTAASLTNQDFTIDPIKSRSSLHAFICVNGLPSIRPSSKENHWQKILHDAFYLDEDDEKDVSSQSKESSIDKAPDFYVVGINNSTFTKWKSSLEKFKSNLSKLESQQKQTRQFEEELERMKYELLKDRYQIVSDELVVKDLLSLHKDAESLRDISIKVGKQLAQQIFEKSIFGKRPFTLIGIGYGSYIEEQRSNNANNMIDDLLANCNNNNNNNNNTLTNSINNINNNFNSFDQSLWQNEHDAIPIYLHQSLGGSNTFTPSTIDTSNINNNNNINNTFNNTLFDINNNNSILNNVTSPTTFNNLLDNASFASQLLNYQQQHQQLQQQQIVGGSVQSSPQQPIQEFNNSINVQQSPPQQQQQQYEHFSTPESTMNVVNENPSSPSSSSVVPNSNHSPFSSDHSDPSPSLESNDSEDESEYEEKRPQKKRKSIFDYNEFYGPELPKNVLLHISSKDFQAYRKKFYSGSNISKDITNKLNNQLRKIKNRESAQRSREKKSRYVEELQDQLDQVNKDMDKVKEENNRLRMENDMLRAQNEKLQSASSSSDVADDTWAFLTNTFTIGSPVVASGKKLFCFVLLVFLFGSYIINGANPNFTKVNSNSNNNNNFNHHLSPNSISNNNNIYQTSPPNSLLSRSLFSREEIPQANPFENRVKNNIYYYGEPRILDRRYVEPWESKTDGSFSIKFEPNSAHREIQRINSRRNSFLHKQSTPTSAENDDIMSNKRLFDSLHPIANDLQPLPAATTTTTTTTSTSKQQPSSFSTSDTCSISEFNNSTLNLVVEPKFFAGKGTDNGKYNNSDIVNDDSVESKAISSRSSTQSIVSNNNNQKLPKITLSLLVPKNLFPNGSNDLSKHILNSNQLHLTAKLLDIEVADGGSNHHDHSFLETD
eukprot:gene11938-14611_t